MASRAAFVNADVLCCVFEQLDLDQPETCRWLACSQGVCKAFKLAAEAVLDSIGLMQIGRRGALRTRAGQESSHAGITKLHVFTGLQLKVANDWPTSLSAALDNMPRLTCCALVVSLQTETARPAVSPWVSHPTQSQMPARDVCLGLGKHPTSLTFCNTPWSLCKQVLSMVESIVILRFDRCADRGNFEWGHDWQWPQLTLLEITEDDEGSVRQLQMGGLACLTHLTSRSPKLQKVILSHLPLVETSRFLEIEAIVSVGFAAMPIDLTILGATCVSLRLLTEGLRAISGVLRLELGPWLKFSASSLASLHHIAGDAGFRTKRVEFEVRTGSKVTLASVEAVFDVVKPDLAPLKIPVSLVVVTASGETHYHNKADFLASWSSIVEGAT